MRFNGCLKRFFKADGKPIIFSQPDEACAALWMCTDPRIVPQTLRKHNAPFGAFVSMGTSDYFCAAAEFSYGCCFRRGALRTKKLAGTAGSPEKANGAYGTTTALYPSLSNFSRMEFASLRLLNGPTQT